MSRRWIAPLLVLVMLAATLAAWDSLPERVPTHWGISGEPDAWGSRSSLFILPLAALGILALLTLLLRIGPRRQNLERAESTWWTVVNIAMAMLCALHLVVLAASLGWNVDVSRIVYAAAGLGIAAMGNYMPRMRPNWWMGIRTPWTLENDEVWRETHRVGGRWMLVGGLIGAASVVLPAPTNFYVFMTAVMTCALVPVVYSYFVWRRLGGDSSGRTGA